TACGDDDENDNKAGSESQEHVDESSTESLTPAGQAAVAVDLGLPSGTLWADRNVGADKPEAYGDYFAWGETTPKANYSWTNYKWAKGSYEVTKYSPSIDNKDELDPEDDAAQANWGGKWRMPTRDDIIELINNTNSQWVVNYNNTGINGYKFTNKSNPSKFIFLPAAGGHDSSPYSVGVEGLYWSSSLDMDYTSRGDLLGFSEDEIPDWFSQEREEGQTVRPVRK
ncbi:MAG: hypothetical protein IJ786_04480, partial [Bacteroidaceae bacterium]|nr:hypothetical protein [Bacteroidaceae bacterium]